MIRRRSPLKRGVPLVRKTPLRQRSKKRRAEERERADLRARVIERDGGCVVASMIAFARCAGPLDVDEIVSRGRGGSYLDDANTQTLCRRHHEAKHSHTHAASILGLWGEHARRIHVRQELGDSPSLEDLWDLGLWAQDVLDR